MPSGESGEREAERYLNGRGLVTVAKNHRAPGGEVDLVMLDGEALVFVEVRTRSDGSRGTAVETIDRRKRARIVTAARDYLEQNPWPGSIRFDVVGITGLGDERVLEYIPDAFVVGE